MASTSQLNSLTTAELRKKLLEYGKDLPTSVGKDFQIKVLMKAMKEKEKRMSESKYNTKNNKYNNRSRSVAQTSSQSSDPSDDEPETEPEPPAVKRKRPTISSAASDNYSSDSRPSIVTNARATRASMRGGVKQSPQPEIEQPVILPSSPRRNYPTPRASSVRTSASNITSPKNQTVSSPTISRQSQPQYRPNFDHGDMSRQGAPLAYSNMFGLIISGRMVQSDFLPNREVNPNKFKIDIAQPESVEHLVVFLTGNQIFPAGTGGQVFLGCSTAQNLNEEWHLLGHITNDRPSRIFKVTDFRNNIVALQESEYASQNVIAQLGISIEPLNVILDSYTFNPQIQL